MSAEKVNEKSAEPAANDYEIGVDEPAGLTELEIQTGEREVFQKTDNGIDFRTVGWPRATAIFLKVIFSTGVLSKWPLLKYQYHARYAQFPNVWKHYTDSDALQVPSAMASLGAVPGALSVIGWGCLNTYLGVVLGNFRLKHPSCHSIADMAYIVGGPRFGPFLKELAGLLFLFAWILGTGSGIVGVAVALNTFSAGAACTVWWCFLAIMLFAAIASIRTFHQIGWLTWVGFVSIFVAVFIVVIGVTQQHSGRPAGAPRIGPYELGYFVIAHPTFSSGVTASATIFVSSAGPVAFVPVISEMRNPAEYNKALYTCMGFVHCAYLVCALIVYKYCGIWVTSPSLGSAGVTIQIVSYGIGFIGLLVSGALGLPVAAKYLFVRILRNTKHLQSNTFVHWGTWLSCTFGLSIISFILSQAIPIFNYILALTGSLCFAPLTIILTGCLWLDMHKTWRNGTMLQRGAFYIHILIPLLGAFMCVGGTYAVIQQIITAYADGTVGGIFSCENNSGIIRVNK